MESEKEEEKEEDLNDFLDSPEKIPEGTLYLGKDNIEVSLLNFIPLDGRYDQKKEERKQKNRTEKKFG